MNYLNKHLVKDPNMVSRKIDEEVILVPIRQNVADLDCIYTLNAVGARIWKLIDSKRGVKEIKETIVKEYEVSEKEAEEDLLKFLSQLEEIRAVAPAKKKGT